MELKNQLEQKLTAKLNEWKADIDRAEADARAAEAQASARQADAAANEALHERVSELKARVEAGERQLARLRDATEAQLTRFKDEVLKLVA